MANALIDDESRLDALETNIESYRISRDSWTVLVLAVAFFAAIVSVVGIGLALRAADDDGGGALAGEPVHAELSEFAVSLSATEVSSAGTLMIHNNGTASPSTVRTRPTRSSSPRASGTPC
jgi:uncharacterized membrane protein